MMMLRCPYFYSQLPALVWLVALGTFDELAFEFIVQTRERDFNTGISSL